MDMLFESEKQKEATERLLASVRVRTINSEIDAYLNEMLGYAKEIDSILEKNNLGARYLDRVSMIDKVDSVYLDEDLINIDFRIKEEILIELKGQRFYIGLKHLANQFYIKQTSHLRHDNLASFFHFQYDSMLICSLQNFLQQIFV